MVDVIRTKAQILADMADNVSGDVSPQDMRNMFLSLLTPVGQIYENSNVVETTINTQNVFEPANVPTTPPLITTERITGSPDFDMPVAGRLRYLGLTPIDVRVSCSLSMTASGNNKLVALRIAKDGVTDIASQIERKVSTGVDIGASGLHLVTTLTTNQYIELYVANETDDVNITITDMTLRVVGSIAT